MLDFFIWRILVKSFLIMLRKYVVEQKTLKYIDITHLDQLYYAFFSEIHPNKLSDLFFKIVILFKLLVASKIDSKLNFLHIVSLIYSSCFVIFFQILFHGIKNAMNCKFLKIKQFKPSHKERIRKRYLRRSRHC